MSRIDQVIYADLRRALEAEGMVFGLSPEDADLLLSKRIGRIRFRRFCKTMDCVRSGSKPIDAAYRVVADVHEANALMSAQAEVSLAVNAAVVDASGVLDADFDKVGELGCFSGSVTRYLARARPKTSFVGFDRLTSLLDVAQQHGPSNLSLETWDYHAESLKRHRYFDVLYGSFPVDFATADVDITDEVSIRLVTEQFAAQFLEPAKHWRTVVSEEKELIVALRIPHVFGFSGVIQVAAAAGWELLEERCAKISVRGELFPLCVFRASEARQMVMHDIEALARWWEDAPMLEP